MGLPSLIQDHLLFVTGRTSDLLALYSRVFADVLESGGTLLCVCSAPNQRWIEESGRISGLRSQRALVQPVDALCLEGRPAWKSICESIDQLLDERTGSGGDRAYGRSVYLVVDLDAVFEKCSASSEMMSVVFHLSGKHNTIGTTVVDHVSPRSLPKSLPGEFFDVHTHWDFGELAGHADAGELDLVLHRLAMENTEAKQRFLATGRDETEDALEALPRFFGAYRHGILVLDRRFGIRFCSERCARIIGREPQELIGKSISACMDGVDLVTLKHECEKLSPGSATGSPFVASWRLSPGVYEAREVRVDPVKSIHQTVGYILAVGKVESVRGPRAVYQQLKREKANQGPASEPAQDDLELAENEALSGNLHGTQITRREHEIILLILRGMSNREISNQLSIAEVTVKKHLTSVYRKLRITSRRELALSFSRPGGNS